MEETSKILRPMISIKFEHTDEEGCYFSAESKFKVYEEYCGTLEELGKSFNVFLRQIGYAFDKDYILMKSIDIEEYEVLSDFLEEYRRQKSKRGGE